MGISSLLSTAEEKKNEMKKVLNTQNTHIHTYTHTQIRTDTQTHTHTKANDKITKETNLTNIY